MRAQELIEKIHYEVDNAHQLLLEHAVEVIKANKVEDIDYVEKMKELGFTKSQAVVEAEKKSEQLVESARMANLITYYRDHYPLLKFLTEEKLDEICDKYNLVHGPVHRYKKNVPKKNLNDIVNAQALAKKDECLGYFTIKSMKFMGVVPKEAREWILSHRFEEHSMGLSSRMLAEQCPFLGSDWAKWRDVYESAEVEDVDLRGLFIVAPKKHFDLKGAKEIGKKGFFQSAVSHVSRPAKDPIVYRYVKGGVQVLTKWGLEANDPELANPLDN